MESQSTFSRSMHNSAKMGAYYTDVEHCQAIQKMFLFPEEKEVCVLEPSIGDATAVVAATGADTNPYIKIFGVELNDSVAAKTAKHPHVESLVCADFLNGVRIRKNAFSFCFANPPYMDSNDGTGTVRMERLFLEKIVEYLSMEGILVWIVPHRVFTEPSHFRYFASRFQILSCYRFREQEYKKWQQVVVVGRKKAFKSYTADEIKEMLCSYTEDVLSVLPHTFSERIEVFPSKETGVDLFTTRFFDPEEGLRAMQTLPEDWLNSLSHVSSVPTYNLTSVGQPPTALKTDSLYLLATSGIGQGLTGTDGVDLHLQRGVVKVVEESRDENLLEIVTSRSQTCMTIIQEDGSIDTLK